MRSGLALIDSSRRMGTIMSRATARKPPASPVESALDRARHGERVILRRGKKPVAAVVSIADLKLLEELDAAHLVTVTRVRPRGYGSSPRSLERLREEQRAYSPERGIQ